VNRTGAIAAIALLAGCSGGIQSQPSSTAGGTLAQLTSVVSPRARVRSRRVTDTHAIKPDCCAYLKTLFVSDLGTNEVQMYEFPSNKYIGQVSPPPEGFAEPHGMCSDNQGNVFVANTAKMTIDEFSHNGAYIRPLSDSGEYPAGCAFDKATGNLAVSNVISTTSAPGSVSIYTHATGTPKIFSSGGFQRVFFLAYAGKTGVLYLDGETPSYEAAYGSLKGGSIKPIAITGATIGYAGSLSWSAKTQSMNIGDQQSAVCTEFLRPARSPVRCNSPVRATSFKARLKVRASSVPISQTGTSRSFPIPEAGSHTRRSQG
jgi:hypothetical protein